MNKIQVKDKRLHPRAERVLSLEFRLISDQESRRDHSWRLSMTTDVSRGGVAFYTDANLKNQDVIEMKIIMSGMIEIYSGFAKVVRVDKRESAAYALIAAQFILERHKKNRLSHGGVC